MRGKGIVISHTPFGEADKYVQIFTERWGMITALAKSARKSRRRYAGGLDLFCHIEVSLRGDPSKSPYLVELTVLNSFTRLRADLDKILLAGKISQWIKKLVHASEPAPEIYKLLGQSLSLIENESTFERLELLSLVFKLKLMSILGLKPSMESKEGAYYFDIEAGGLSEAKSLSYAHILSELERQFMHHCDQMSLARFSSLQLSDFSTKKLSRLMTDFAAYHQNTRLPI